MLYLEYSGPDEISNISQIEKTFGMLEFSVIRAVSITSHIRHIATIIKNAHFIYTHHEESDHLKIITKLLGLALDTHPIYNLTEIKLRKEYE